MYVDYAFCYDAVNSVFISLLTEKPHEKIQICKQTTCSRVLCTWNHFQVSQASYDIYCNSLMYSTAVTELGIWLRLKFEPQKLQSDQHFWNINIKYLSRFQVYLRNQQNITLRPQMKMAKSCSLRGFLSLYLLHISFYFLVVASFSWGPRENCPFPSLWAALWLKAWLRYGQDMVKVWWGQPLS